MSKWLLISDIDDTLIGDDAALHKLTQEIMRHRDKIILVYNSSRPCASIRKSLDEYPDLLNLKPDYVAGALGTEIEVELSGKQLLDYLQFITEDWNREEISSLMARIGLEPHSEEYQTPLKASYNIDSPEVYLDVKEQLELRGLRAKVILSGRKNLDIIPLNSGKGAAIEFLKDKTGINTGRVVVCGDSANDLDMFSISSKGIIVGNADPELKKLRGPNIFHASKSYAGGVLEGLYYWGVIT
jgi:sucrose-6-phosphatase